MQTSQNGDGAGRPLQGTPTPLRRAEQSTPRAPRVPRCGVCDGLDPVLHCENCDEPVCARHIQRVFACEGVPASYLCTLCVEERRPPVAEPLPIEWAGVAPWA